MEEGSSIVWRQLLHLRFPLDDLHEMHPQLANDFAAVSRKIDAASISHVSSTTSQNQVVEGVKGLPPTLEEVARNHRANVAKWEELLDEIRALPGFEDFLKPTAFAFLREAARDCPIIAINVSSRRCDALVIFSSHPIKHIPLTQLTLEMIERLFRRFTRCLDENDVRSRRNDMRRTKHDPLPSGEDDLRAILGDLWRLVVGPIWEEIKDLVSTSVDYQHPP
jgi:hypothetical protein